MKIKNLILTSILALATLGLSAGEVTTQSSAGAIPTEDIVLTKGNHLYLIDYFHSVSVSAVMQQALEMVSKRRNANDPIYFVLDTPGGSIQAGLELINFLNSLGTNIVTITNFSASMGFQTVQGLGKRIILPTGTMMSHKARGGIFGEFSGTDNNSQLDNRLTYWKEKVLQMDKKVVNRSKGVHTITSYANLIENEYWCAGEACAAEGFVDAIGNVSCDSTLSGIRKVVVTRWARDGRKGPQVVELVDIYSQCPLIVSPLEWNVLIDGKPLFKGIGDKKAEIAKLPDSEIKHDLLRVLEDSSKQNGELIAISPDGREIRMAP